MNQIKVKLTELHLVYVDELLQERPNCLRIGINHIDVDLAKRLIEELEEAATWLIDGRRRCGLETLIYNLENQLEENIS